MALAESEARRWGVRVKQAEGIAASLEQQAVRESKRSGSLERQLQR